MKDDLIRRSDAIKAIEELPNCYNGWSDTYDKAYIIGTLEEVPRADVIPRDYYEKVIEELCRKHTEEIASMPTIVRCKECKYGEVDDADFPNQYFCSHHGCDWNDGEHYCSYGEREGE